MANLNDLELSDEPIGNVDVETVPTFSARNPIPQPGLYVFRLPPAPVIYNCFKLDNTADGQYLIAELREEAALLNETTGKFYDARISNRPRILQIRNKETGLKEPVAISDMAQLLRVLGSIPENKTNRAYGDALVHAGEMRFKAEHTLQASCNPKRDVYKNGSVLVGKKGCGRKFALEAYQPREGRPVYAIPKETDGKYALRFECVDCEATISVFGQLRGFTKAASE